MKAEPAMTVKAVSSTLSDSNSLCSVNAVDWLFSCPFKPYDWLISVADINVDWLIADSMMAVDWLNQSFERSVISFVLSDVMMPSKF